MHETQYPYGPCHLCGGAIAIPGHELATPALRSCYYCERCGKWLSHPKHHDNERKTANTEKSVCVFRLPKSQLTLDLKGGES
jgi:hypothetical protein